MPQFIIDDLHLSCGRNLPNAIVSYETFGQLDFDGGNAILITHGLTSGVDMLEPTSMAGEGSWADLLKPGRALDAQRYFVVCSNVVGSSLGSTSPASNRPGTNKPWGPDFPPLTISDIVSAQKELLTSLGVNKLKCVIGPSFGGIQALQWALDYPEMVDSIGVIVSGFQWPSRLASDLLRVRLALDPKWAQGWYASDNYPFETMAEVRYETLVNYGMRQFLNHLWPGEENKIKETLQTAARNWAMRFDANALLTLQSAGEKFNILPRIAEFRCPMLFAASRTDIIFPCTPEVQDHLKRFPNKLYYVEIDSNFGHSASGIEVHQWEPTLRQILE